MTTDQEVIQTPARVSAPEPIAVPAMVGIGLLAATIAIHTTELSGKIGETMYLGAGYVLLIAASIVSIVLIAQHDRRGWMFGLLTSGATLIGFILTRTTGLPGATGDIGNWTETIAVWSLISEGAFVVLAAWTLSSTSAVRSG